VICALVIGREGSSGFPGKNVALVHGRPLVEYPIRAAMNSRLIDRVYVSTDSPRLATIARSLNCRLLDRPAHLATKEALGEDVFVHGYRAIARELEASGESVELMVLLHANAATICASTIDDGIRVLRERRDIDSAVTVSSYNMWSPLRARRIGEDGLLHPFVAHEAFGDASTLNCDRDSQGDVWFADMGVSVVRPHCLDQISQGILPQRWMGRAIYPLKQWGGLDVDYQWQMGQVEAWICAHGLDGTGHD